MAKTILVTGSTDGIGKETARELAQEGARVIVHGRSPAKVDAALEDLRTTTEGAALESVTADFGSLADVRRLASRATAPTRSPSSRTCSSRRSSRAAWRERAW